MQRRIGLFFASRHGQTRAITVFLANRFADYGACVTLIDLTTPETHAIRPQLDEFDTVLIGAPVYVRRYPAAVRRFLHLHRDTLARHASTGFFSVSLTAADARPGGDLESIGPLREMITDLTWTPDWIASFGGALEYRQYNPLLRLIMRRISRQYGGPTDTTRDHELTRWTDVAAFAQHVAANQPVSRYRSSALSLPARTLDRLMPVYEQRIVARHMVRATPAEIRRAIESTQPSDMRLADGLARLRTLAQPQPTGAAHRRFGDAARDFGAVPISRTESNELAGGLIGKFWQRTFGILRLADEDAFNTFDEAGYSKVITDFWFDDVREQGTIVRAETRIHSIGPDARDHFRWYWRIVGLGIRLYMRSVLHGIQHAVTHLRTHPAVLPSTSDLPRPALRT